MEETKKARKVEPKTWFVAVKEKDNMWKQVSEDGGPADCMEYIREQGEVNRNYYIMSTGKPITLEPINHKRNVKLVRA